MKIDKEINDLASHVIAEALKTGKDAPTFEEKTEALKTVTSFYAMLLKQKGKPEESDGSTFADFTKQLEETQDGKLAPRDRRRPGPASSGRDN